jgi:hypothetical protein
MPGIKEKQFYKEDYKTRDYGTMINQHEKHLLHTAKMREKIAKEAKNKNWQEKKVRTWTEDDQLFEDELWAS